MKVKNIAIALLALIITQSISATKFTIINKVEVSNMIEVDPVWRGNPRGWVGMALGAPKSFDSGLHHLQEIRWRLPNELCWRANVEDVFGGMWGRVRTNVVITLYDNGEYTIDLGQGQGMRRQAVKTDCSYYGNF